MKSFNTKKYINPPQYSSYRSYRSYIINNCTCKCSYCSIRESESVGTTFEIDHFRPKKLFPKLENDIYNLRLACRKCNLFKSDFWIDASLGCNRDCNNCNNKICTKNIERFFDSMNEDVSLIMAMDNNFLLQPINNSFVSKYTIDKLRLNRKNLIDLRKNRFIIKELINQIEDLIKYCERQKSLNDEYYERIKKLRDKNKSGKKDLKLELCLLHCEKHKKQIIMSIATYDKFRQTLFELS